jgi:hypothetical protein
MTWDVFDGFVKEYNEVRTSMTDVCYAILDKSMSGWRPKMSVLGGLPNITFEIRKPVNLGTMIKKGCECQTGMMVNHDTVKGSVQQGSKNSLANHLTSQNRSQSFLMSARCCVKLKAQKLLKVVGLVVMLGLGLLTLVWS